MNTVYDNSRGSTIIELLVVLMIIISIFSIMLVSNFPQVKLQLSLSRVAYEFAQSARKAQALSLATSQYVNLQNQLQPVTGYGVSIDLKNNKKYNLYADALPGNQVYDATDYLVQANDFSIAEPGIIIKEIDGVAANNVSINFSLFNQNVTIYPAPVRTTVNVVFAIQSDPSKTKTVSINTAGLIAVK